MWCKYAFIRLDSSAWLSLLLQDYTILSLNRMYKTHLDMPITTVALPWLCTGALSEEKYRDVNLHVRLSPRLMLSRDTVTSAL